MAEESKEPPSAPKGGSSKKMVVLLIVAIVAAAASASAGALFGPALLGRAKPPAAQAEGADAEKEEAPSKPEEAGEAVVLDPLIVDVKKSDGDLHHLKVGIALETAKKLPEEEVKKFLPRARDAALTYLRSLSFEDATASEKFDKIRADLGERINKAVGKGKISKVLFTDFVAQ